MWLWMEDPALELIYKTFANYVEARTGYRCSDAK